MAAIPGRGFLAAWVIALLTFCSFVLRLDLSTTGFLYLLTVVVVAQTCGFRQATLTSLIGVACLDYFIVPPIFSFEFGSTQNLVALATFELLRADREPALGREKTPRARGPAPAQRDGKLLQSAGQRCSSIFGCRPARRLSS